MSMNNSKSSKLSHRSRPLLLLPLFLPLNTYPMNAIEESVSKLENTLPQAPTHGKKLYLDDHSQLHQFLAAHPNYISAELLKEKIADIPKGIWISPEWYTDYAGIVAQATAQNSVPIFVVYNAIKRDLGGLSAGGALNLEDYFYWLDTFLSKTGSLEMIVILEPD